MHPLRKELLTQTICLFVLAAIATATALHFLRDVLVPFVLALFLAIGLKPLVDLQVRRIRVGRARMPHALAVVTTLVAAAVFLAAIGLLVAVSVQRIVASAGRYQARTQELLERAVDALPLATMGTTREAVMDMFVKLPAEAAGGILTATGEAMAAILSRGLLVIIFLCFQLFGSRTRARPADGIWGQIERDTRKYIVTKVTVSAVTGLLVGLTLWLLGVDLALVFGLLVFLLNFIPSIGSIIATLLPLPVVLLDPSISMSVAALAIVIPAAIQFAIGNGIEPRIVGRSFDLHPVVFVLALMFWGVIWGIVGMFLAIPITASIRILMLRSRLTIPIANALAGRFALRTPQEEAAAAEARRAARQAGSSAQ